MTNKIKIISLSVVAVLLFGTFGSVLAYDKACTTPEAQMVREAVQTGQAKLASLSFLEKVEAHICTLQKLTPKEIAAIVAKKKAMAGFTPTPGANKVPPPPTLGIQGFTSPDVLGKNLILGTNTWKGYIDGKLTVVTGTAEADNPSQGVLFMWEPGNIKSNIKSSRTYLTPAATGPLKIVSEENSIITVQSVAGTYEVYDANTDTRHNVTTKGGTTYTFNLGGDKVKPHFIIGHRQVSGS